MTDDIVDRLRRCESVRDMAEGADEIERLRAELASTQSALEMVSAMETKKWGEIAHLRETRQQALDVASKRWDEIERLREEIAVLRDPTYVPKLVSGRR